MQKYNLILSLLALLALINLFGCVQNHNDPSLSSSSIGEEVPIVSAVSSQDAVLPVEDGSSESEKLIEPPVTGDIASPPPEAFDHPVGRVDEWEAGVRLWKKEQENKYQLDNYGNWQKQVVQLLDSCVEALDEEDYAGYIKNLEAYNWKGREVAWNILGANFLLKNPDKALPIIQEHIERYDWSVGPIQITWSSCDYNLAQLKIAEQDLINQRVIQSGVGQQISGVQIRDGKLVVEGFADCDDLKRYLNEKDYSRFVQLGIIDPDHMSGILA